MSTVGSASTTTEGGDLAERRVTPLELFFDLVFVFALTQVTGFLADHLTWTGGGYGGCDRLERVFSTTSSRIRPTSWILSAAFREKGCGEKYHPEIITG
jgi:hypothetical protein